MVSYGRVVELEPANGRRGNFRRIDSERADEDPTKVLATSFTNPVSVSCSYFNGGMIWPIKAKQPLEGSQRRTRFDVSYMDYLAPIVMRTMHRTSPNVRFVTRHNG
jgi:hypothetical protein